MKAIILAGGRGARLQPYTFVVPKPLVPVGKMPVLELLIKRLRKFGLTDLIITISYLGSLIRALCGNGSQWGVNIAYSEEKEPLGTIGPLTLIKEHLSDTFLVINGDTLTDIDVTRLVQFHRQKGGVATIAASRREIKIELGVLEVNESHLLVGFQEKPAHHYLASMGMYVFQPEILRYVPEGIPFGFDDLMKVLLGQRVPVYTYVHEGFWLDIGIKDDLERAQRNHDLLRTKILGD